MACILNVEDDSPSRFLKSRILEGAGFQVLEAVTCADALRTAGDDRLQLVLLDLRLPDGDGYYVCEQITALRPSRRLRPRDRRPFTVRFEVVRETTEGLSIPRLRWMLEPLRTPNG